MSGGGRVADVREGEVEQHPDVRVGQPVVGHPARPADPGRLRVLVALLEGEMCVCDIAAAAGASESAASHHLRLLRAHRVVQVRRSGRMAYYRLADAHVRMLLDLALTHIGHAPAAAHPERPA